MEHGGRVACGIGDDHHLLAARTQAVDAVDHAGNGGLTDVEHAEGIEQEHVELVGDRIESVGPDELGLTTQRRQAMAHGFIFPEGPLGALVLDDL
jgi:hypothetical protein